MKIKILNLWRYYIIYIFLIIILPVVIFPLSLMIFLYEKYLFSIILFLIGIIHIPIIHKKINNFPIVMIEIDDKSNLISFFNFKEYLELVQTSSGSYFISDVSFEKLTTQEVIISSKDKIFQIKNISEYDLKYLHEISRKNIICDKINSFEELVIQNSTPKQKLTIFELFYFIFLLSLPIILAIIIPEIKYLFLIIGIYLFIPLFLYMISYKKIKVNYTEFKKENIFMNSNKNKIINLPYSKISQCILTKVYNAGVRQKETEFSIKTIDNKVYDIEGVDLVLNENNLIEIIKIKKLSIIVKEYDLNMISIIDRFSHFGRRLR